MSYDLIIVTDIIRQEERRLIEAAASSGLRALNVNVISRGLSLREEAVAPYALIRTISMYRALYSASFLEAVGYRTINRARSILLAGDKALSIPFFHSAGIPVPPTYIAFSPEAALDYITSRPKPLVDKPPIGSWGRLVSLVENDIVAKIIIEHREELPSPQMKVHLIQDYIPINAQDIRCFVVGGDVVACMKRRAPKGEWRTNVAIGAETYPYSPTDEEIELSVKSVEVIGADYGSVDIGVTPDGSRYLFEVNGVPEFKGLERATGRDVAKAIIGLIKR